jgi:23S rRNA pseudouridine2605 synthase
LAKSKKKMTLDRVLSRHGFSSRKRAQDAIQAGIVKVNGCIVRNSEFWVDLQTDTVHIKGKKVRQARRIYLLFYKPKGIIISHGDRRGRKTIYDCLDPGLPWVAPVGRLDMNTSGLLLLTNDTEFSNHVTSPASKVHKTYLVKANTLVPDDLVKRLSQGFKMKDGGYAQPYSVRRKEDRGKYSWLEITLTEGKNREIHRLLESAGLKVLKLVRIKIGPCTLEGLQVGQWRELLKSELALFYSPHTAGKDYPEHENVERKTTGKASV